MIITKRAILFQWAFLLLVLTVTQRTNAQVVINEFCTANYTDWTVSGENEDWVEFYNPGASAFNLAGYWLSDDAANPQKWSVPAGTSVPANGYLHYTSFRHRRL